MGSAGAAELVLYSPHFALVLSELVQAGLCRAEPNQARRGGGKEKGRGVESFRRVQTC